MAMSISKQVMFEEMEADEARRTAECSVCSDRFEPEDPDYPPDPEIAMCPACRHPFEKDD